MPTLLVITALVEAATGLALLILPSLPVSLLLGTSLDASSGAVVARVAGAALLSLAFACWLSRNDRQSQSAPNLTKALLLYNLVVAAVLVYARVGLELSGIGLWPVAVAHVALAGWCVLALRDEKA
jgi:hypothetical protein